MSGGYGDRHEKTCSAPADLIDKYHAAYAAVMHGVQGTCALDIDGVSKDVALDIAADFFGAAGRDLFAIPEAEK